MSHQERSHTCMGADGGLIVKEDVEGGVVDTRPTTGAHYGVLNVGRFTVLTVS